MLFSERFQVTRAESVDWFDPILEIDTRLFLDPFLLGNLSISEFEGSRQEIVDFFQRIFELFAASSGPHDSRWRVATNALRFPEPYEFRLGYTRGGYGGRGPGRELGNDMVASIAGSIERGVQRLERFEELPLFNEGIGPDMISDLCGNVLKHRFVRFTQRIAAENKVPTSPVTIRNARFDLQDVRWETLEVDLPTDAAGAPVLLTPMALLNRLPTVSTRNFKNYLWKVHGPTMRDEFGYSIKRQLNKAAIVSIARRARGLVDAFIEQARKRPTSYPLDRDPDGVYQPYVLTRKFSLANRARVSPVRSRRTLQEFVEFLVEDFRHLIEDQRHSYQLWEGGKQRNERASKLAFWARAELYCEDAHVAAAMESDFGAGPVDICVSRPPDIGLIEIKLMSNSDYWRGLEVQLPRYLAAASDTAFGHFVGIALRDSHVAGPKWKELSSRAAAAAKREARWLKARHIDGRLRPGASRARP